MVPIIVVLTLFYHSDCSQWIRYDDEDCPKCVVYTTETNFSSMISFESKVLIGARNSIYEIDFSEEISTKHEDRTEPDDLDSCIRLGQQEEDCQNFYKVILRLNQNDLFICGTSAFRPKCGVRTIQDLSYSAHINDGLGICPANPRSSTTYLKLKDAQFGFAGTERASSSEYAISLINLGYGSYDVLAKTKSDNHWLNKPEFIYSFEYGDHVYFVLKEIAVEVMSIEQIYSRVVRICKRDHGGGGPFFSNNFVTFLKARIYCSYTRAGQSPYDFNELGGAYFLDGYLYGLFSGPTSVIETGSVLCRFSMEGITRVFEGKAKYFEYGTFRDEQEAKPFTCQEKRTAGDAIRNQLMSGVITSSDPVFYSAVQMRKLVVQSIKIGDESSIIANTATNDGNLIRIGFKENYGGTVRHRLLKMAHAGPVVELSTPEGDPTQVFLMSNDWVGYAPLRMECGHYTTCQSCQSAFPYCGWCSAGAERVCATVAQCEGERTWRSPYENCPPLARFRTEPEDKTVTLTESNPVVEVDLLCESEGGATPSWSRLSSQIASSATIVNDGTTLRLRVASYMDAGTYICSLKGEAGNVDAEAELTVLVSPTVTRVGPRNVSVARGDDVTLTCLSEGHPKPTVTWKLKNGSPLPDSARVDQTSGELKLIRIVPADAGRYFCEVSNNVGVPKMSQEIEVSVKDYNPQNPDSNATIDADKPFDYKKVIIIVCCVVILIVIVAAITHFVLKKRKRTKEDVPAMFPLTYQEQIYGDMPHTPSAVMTPHFVEEQMQFDWNQAQHLMGQQLLTQQLMGQIGPAMPYLLPQREVPEDEPPPAYQAEIELHQPPSQARRPPQTDHFFTPVQRVDSPGYSAGNSMDSHPGHSGGLSEPGYSIASIEPLHGAPRGPTPPPRTDIRPPPTSSLEVEVDAESRTSPPPDAPTSPHPPPSSSSPSPHPPLPPGPPPDAESIHEYERIGLSNNSAQTALLSEQDNASSRGSSLLQT